ncbi:MAG: hypothetical protein K940chlam1_00383 [Candidatus Anoxychlamydiales bacterium]|nr:hypothetical protein [Candidatus Anoxychlamydiales bacterium]NGX36196.1 hypothetical protein [Candidatus Anoxychlamydiales bacterium]
MVSLYPTVPKITNSRLYNASKNLKKHSDTYINRKIATISSAIFGVLGGIGKYAPTTAVLGSYSHLSIMLGGITALPFIISRIHKKCDDKIKILHRTHEWSKNVGHHNLSKISAIASLILGLIALYATINPIIWQALFTASMILSLTTLLLNEIIAKQYKSIVFDKNSKGIRGFEISMTKNLGLYFGEAKA